MSQTIEAERYKYWKDYEARRNLSDEEDESFRYDRDSWQTSSYSESTTASMYSHNSITSNIQEEDLVDEAEDGSDEYYPDSDLEVEKERYWSTRKPDDLNIDYYAKSEWTDLDEGAEEDEMGHMERTENDLDFEATWEQRESDYDWINVRPEKIEPAEMSQPEEEQIICRSTAPRSCEQFVLEGWYEIEVPRCRLQNRLQMTPVPS